MLQRWSRRVHPPKRNEGNARAHVHTEARRRREELVRHRRHRRRPRPPRGPGREPAPWEAQAPVRPHADCGDYVIIINADKVVLTNGKADRKFAYRHSGYPGGLTATPYRELLATRPERAVEKAVKGMVPHTRLGRAQLKKLRVYAGGEHPHASQNPQAFEITQVAQ